MKHEEGITGSIEGHNAMSYYTIAPAKKVTLIRYEAADGKQFETESECNRHNAQMELNLRLVTYDIIHSERGSIITAILDNANLIRTFLVLNGR